MSITRLVPHMYVFTPFGVAEAHFFESPEGFETNAVWTCFQLETKECWQWPTPMIRICDTVSGMRGPDYSDFHISDDYFEAMRHHILRHKKSPFYERALEDSMGGGSNRSVDLRSYGEANGYPKDWIKQTKSTLDNELKERGIRPSTRHNLLIDLLLLALGATVLYFFGKA